MDRYYEEGISTVTVETDVIWTSSNPDVAIVNNGVITAVGVGTAIITATTIDGNKSVSCSVTVSDSTFNSASKCLRIGI